VFKQRLDFPFHKRIKTTDRFLTMQGQNIVETTVRSPTRKRIETTDRLPAIEGRNIVETAVRFPI